MSSDPSDLKARLTEELAPQFEVVRRLGESNMATIFLAREAELRRMIAVKVLKPELAQDEVAPLRFAREGQSAARISHPNVTSVYQVGKLSDETPYLIMEHVEGGTLEERVEAIGPFSVDDAKKVIHDIASALAAAHRRGIIHRDVRPSNVMWKAETGRALLTDFGLAAVEPSADHTTRHLTRTGEVVMGDVTFVSPEQLMGESVTGASDIYSLGGLASFLLTGHGPFVGKSAVDVASKHLKAEPPDLNVEAGVPSGLAGLIRRCLSKNAAHRPTAEDVAAATAAGAVSQVEADSYEMPFITALKKRRFVQILMVYGVAGGTLMGLADQLSQNAIIPQSAYALTLGLVVVGFAAACVVAWFHGEKGHQQVSKLEVVLLTVIALVAVLVSWIILT
ncbi:MAG: serine/threonine-protein kinase [Longimicrobiales bacterium]